MFKEGDIVYIVRKPTCGWKYGAEDIKDRALKEKEVCEVVGLHQGRRSLYGEEEIELYDGLGELMTVPVSCISKHPRKPLIILR
jgi:hypothetical protein